MSITQKHKRAKTTIILFAIFLLISLAGKGQNMEIEGSVLNETLDTESEGFVLSETLAKFSVAPLFELMSIYDISDKSDIYFQTALGLHTDLEYKKIKLNINFSHHNSAFANYLDTAIESKQVIPSVGSIINTKGKYYSFNDFSFNILL